MRQKQAWMMAGPVALAVCFAASPVRVWAQGSSQNGGKTNHSSTQTSQAQTQAALPQPASSAVSDAVIESNVLRALAGAKTLAGQDITTTTVFGTVTLTGNVKDESSRELAETLAARVDGVKNVVSKLTVGEAAAQTSQNDANNKQQSQQNMPEQQNQQGSQQEANGNGGPQGGPPPPPYGRRRGPYARQNGNGPRQGQQQGQGPAVTDQVAGRQVTVPAGALLRVRTDQELDSKHTQPGTVFHATALNDIVADGAVAIPRGASVMGTVVEAKAPGILKGEGRLELQLTNVTLGGQGYPLTSDVWGQRGENKTGETVGSAIGLGAVGAVIGAVAGGGPGALIGAAVGGAAGIGASAAVPAGQAYVPAEGVLIFHLQQPTTLTTVSQAELNRLAGNVQPPARQQELGQEQEDDDAPPSAAPYYGGAYVGGLYGPGFYGPSFYGPGFYGPGFYGRGYGGGFYGRGYGGYGGYRGGYGGGYRGGYGGGGYRGGGGGGYRGGGGRFR